jgi:hypothetical protein
MRMEAEPVHRVLVRAKGDYHFSSDKLLINGQHIEINTIQITSVSSKEDCLKSHARQGHIAIYMIDSVFLPFVDLLRRDKESCEIIMALDAQQQEHPDFVRLMFDGIEITRPVGAARKDQMPGDTWSRLPNHIERTELLLLAIAVITGLIFLQLVFR